MTASHTPGPWTVDTGHRTDIDRTVFAHSPIHNNPIAIARVYGEGVMASPDAEKIANARLIAAAPDLLAALNDAAAGFAVLSTAGLGETHEAFARENFAKAKAAIAKAQGTTP